MAEQANGNGVATVPFPSTVDTGQAYTVIMSH